MDDFSVMHPGGFVRWDGPGEKPALAKEAPNLLELAKEQYEMLGRLLDSDTAMSALCSEDCFGESYRIKLQSKLLELAAAIARGEGRKPPIRSPGIDKLIAKIRDNS